MNLFEKSLLPSSCAPSLDGPSLLASLQHTNALPSPAWCPKLTKTLRVPLNRSSIPGIGGREQPRDPWVDLQVTRSECVMASPPHPCLPGEEEPLTFGPRTTGAAGSPGRILCPTPPPIAPHGPARNRPIPAPEAPSTPLVAQIVLPRDVEQGCSIFSQAAWMTWILRHRAA